MTTELTKTQSSLAKIEKHFPAIDEAAHQLRSLVAANDGSPSHAIRQAAAMQSLREALTPEVIEPIMALQNNPLGFKTDKRDGYSPQEVRDVMITALGRGSWMVCNNTNIIAGQCYLTKEFFARMLNEIQGRGNWYFVHGVPRVVRGEKMHKDRQTGAYSKTEGVTGAILETEIHWLEGGKWKVEKLTHAIKGDEYSTSDAFNGKADRKCGAWLLERITGEQIPDGAADDVIDVMARTVTGPVAAEELNAAMAAPADPVPTLAQVGAALQVSPSILRDWCISSKLIKTELAELTDEQRRRLMADFETTKTAISRWLDARDNR
jgi:hypothetical protein